jgi:hypothetical protein
VSENPNPKAIKIYWGKKKVPKGKPKSKKPIQILTGKIPKSFMFN